MQIFITGATGFIGSAVIPQLHAAGHQVLGLTRSQQGTDMLRAMGAAAHLGALEDLDSLSRGAERADAVIHLAFDHDFLNYEANCRKDADAIAALGKPLVGSDRPLLITSAIGMGIATQGELAKETVLDLQHNNPRIASEKAGQDLSLIVNHIQHVSDMATQIATAAEQQSMVAEDMNRNVSGINDSALEMSQAASQLARESELLAGLSRSLDERLAVFRLGNGLPRDLSPGQAPRPSPSRRTDQYPHH